MAIDTIWQKSGVSAIVCREKVKRDWILRILDQAALKQETESLPEAPDNEEIMTVVSAYGSEGSSACYKSPDNAHVR